MLGKGGKELSKGEKSLHGPGGAPWRTGEVPGPGRSILIAQVEGKADHEMIKSITYEVAKNEMYWKKDHQGDMGIDST